MSQYSAAVPSDGQVRPEIKEFFERFYAVSDTPDGHEKYADMFTKDAKLIMASNGVTGREGESTPTHVSSSQDIDKGRHYQDAPWNVGEGCQALSQTSATLLFWCKLRRYHALWDRGLRVEGRQGHHGGVGCPGTLFEG